MTLNSNHNIQLEILTPVHIGTNQEKSWQKNLDFFYDKGKVYIVHQEDIFKKLFERPNGEKEIANYSAKLSSGKLSEIRDYLFQQLDIPSMAYRIFNYAIEPSNEIKPLLRTGLGKPILAGSSIKGSIRTAILTHLIFKEPKFAQNENNLGKKRGNRLFYSDKQLQSYYLGKDPNHDLLRMLQVSDFNLDSNTTNLYKTQSINLYGNSWNIKQSVSNFLECAGKQTTVGKIHIPEKQLKLNQQKGILKKTDLLSFEKLSHIINEHTKYLLEAEIQFWQYEIEEADVNDTVYKYKEELEELEKMAKSCEKNSCILRIGAGSGWDFMTGAWAKDEDVLTNNIWGNLKQNLRNPKYFDTPFPKSRKTLEKNLGLPLGFIKLSFKS